MNKDAQKSDAAHIPVPFKIKTLLFAVWGITKLLRLFGRIKVRGVENLRSTPWENRLLLSNHPSTLDPILIPMVGFMPKMISDPDHHFPWQTPNGGFEDNPDFSFLKKLPIIFLKTDVDGRPNDGEALRRIMRQLKKSTFIIFPEGTRSYHADEPRIQTASGVPVGRARDGIGFLISHMRPTVIPVFVKGTDRVLQPNTDGFGKGIRQTLTRVWFHRVEIAFGKPLDFSPLLPSGVKPTRETYEKIGNAVIERIAALDHPKNNKKQNASSMHKRK